MNQEDLYKLLSEVLDPESKRDLVFLGVVRQVECSNESVSLQIELAQTTLRLSLSYEAGFQASFGKKPLNWA